MVKSAEELISTFLKDIMEENFDIKIREPLKANINKRLDPIIREVGKNLDDDWLEDFKKTSISNLLDSIGGYEYENIDFLKVYKDQIEDKLPSTQILLNEACQKVCNSVITEFRDIFIEEMIKETIENEVLKQAYENAGIDGSLEEIKITIQPHLESAFENLFSKGTMKDIITENKIIDGLIANIFEELTSVASDLAQKKVEEINADALSIYLNTQVGSMVNQLNEIRTDGITSNHEIEPEKEQENNIHQILPQEFKEKHISIQTSLTTLLNEVMKLLARYLEKILPLLYDDWWNEAVIDRLSFLQKQQVEQRGLDSLTFLDLAALLRVLDQNWYKISMEMNLPSEARHFVKEMQTVRNRWAHAGTETFPNEDVYRDLDTLQRFAAVIEADDIFIQKIRSTKTSLLNLK